MMRIARPLFLIVGGLSLAACATGGAPPPPAPTVAAPAPEPARGYGEMAPIPNPDGEEAAKAAPAAPQPRPARPRPAPAAPKPAAKPAPSAGANPQRAAQLRTQGLVQLNRGAIDRAIALLRQAQAADPDNALIQRDLERAMRIGRAVKATP